MVKWGGDHQWGKCLGLGLDDKGKSSQYISSRQCWPGQVRSSGTGAVNEQAQVESNELAQEGIKYSVLEQHRQPQVTSPSDLL